MPFRRAIAGCAPVAGPYSKVRRPKAATPSSFVATDGTGPIGWDFPIAEHLVLRPIFNLSPHTVTNDLTIARAFIEKALDRDITFLDGGTLKACGLGGSLMLDDEAAYARHNTKINMRITNLVLRSLNNTSAARLVN